MGRGEDLGWTDRCRSHTALSCLLPISVFPPAHDLTMLLNPKVRSSLWRLEFQPRPGGCRPCLESWGR